MKALLLTEYKHLEVTEMPEPQIGDEDVLVRVRACGICGSDVHGYDGSSGRRVPPLIMGHEASGVVAKVGKNVRGFAEGGAVKLDSLLSLCGGRRRVAEQINASAIDRHVVNRTALQRDDIVDLPAADNIIERGRHI